MLSPKTVANVANALRILATADRDTLLQIVIFFFSRYPELASQAVGESPQPNTVTLKIPASATNDWCGNTVNATPEAVERWKAFLRREERISAIKVCREDTGLDLRGAKDVIDYLAQYTS